LDPTAWAIALLVAAIVLCFLEVFIPSMGILTFFAVCCGAGSCYLAFTQSGGQGALFVALNVVGMVAGFVLGFKFLPHSPLALKPSLVEGAKTGLDFPVEELRGASGVAFTDLRPGGTALVGERKVDVVAEGGYI
jgi:membrane-bound serine protease (ClpP class)